MTDEKKPPQEVADEAICAGVDVLSDRLEVGIYAFNPAKRLAAFTLWCDPAQDAGWLQLHALLCGFSGLHAVGVDSGGLHTQQVYRFAHASTQKGAGAAHKVFATKTRSIRGVSGGRTCLSVDVCHKGQPLDGTIELLLIDLHTSTTSSDVFILAHAVYLWQFSDNLQVLSAMPLRPPARH